MSKNTGTSELINYFDLGVNGDVGISGSLTLDTIANAVIDTDKFLVSDNGIIKYRTGAELLSDIGAAPAVAGGYVPYTGAAASVNLGVYSITANAINSAGSGSTAGQINLRSDAFFSLVNGYGSIASGTTNQFNLYQTTGAGVFRGAILSLNSITESATRTFTFPDASGTIALTSSIPANPVGGTGTTNYLSKFTGASTIGNSSIADNGSGRVSVGTGNFYDSFVISNSGTTGWEFSNNGSVITYNRSTAAYIPMTFEASNYILNRGNLGLGVTPSAWSAITAIELGSGVSFSSYTAAAIPNGYITNNAFYNGSNWIYKVSSFPATMVTQTSVGNYAWNTAPSGTAGNAISFTQAMTLTSGGNLLVGTTSDNGAKLQVSGTATITANEALKINANNSTAANNTITGFSADLYAVAVRQKGASAGISGVNFMAQIISAVGAEGLEIYTPNSKELILGTNSTARLTIGTTGAATFSSSASGGQNLRLQTSVAAGRNYVQWANGSGDMGYIGYGGADGKFYIVNQLNDDMIFSTNTTERMRITSSGNVGIGTSSFPDGDAFLIQNSGVWNVTLGLNNTGSGGRKWNIFSTNTSFGQGAGRLLFYNATDGTDAMLITSNNNVLIGTTTDNGAKLQVSGDSYFSGSVGIGTTSPATTLHVVKSSFNPIRMERTGASAATIDLSLFGAGGSNYFVLSGDRVFSSSIDNLTTASAANVFIGTDSNGIASVLHRSTSSLKYKIDIRDYDKGLDFIETLRPVYYKGKNDGNKQFAGLIAEEVHDSGLEEFVQYAQDGSPDSLAYTHITALLINGIKELKAKIDTFKN